MGDISLGGGGGGGGGGSVAIGAHRYWKFANLIPIGNNANAVTLNTIHCYHGVTLLSNPTARCNFYYGSGQYPASGLFDGDDASFWVGQIGCDLSFDFGSAVTFDKMIWVTPAVVAQCPMAATFCYSDDGIIYKVAGQMDFATAMGLADFTNPAASSSYTINLPT